MTAKIMSSFAAGLIIAASVCAAVYFSEPNEATITTKNNELTQEEMKTKLNSAGYVVLTEQEWEEEQAKLEAKKEVASKDKEPAKEIIVYRTILNVVSGMTSIDVGNALVQGKVIDNAQQFSSEVEKRGLASDLQPGTYEIDSEMTIDEVMSILFK